jgi:hypothetical protein
MYSAVNSAVKNHSSAVNSTWNRWCQACTLSASTTPTLTRMAASTTWSNSRPAGVSDSQITRYSRCRHGWRGGPSGAGLATFTAQATGLLNRSTASRVGVVPAPGSRGRRK